MQAHAPVDVSGRLLISDLMKGQPFYSTVPNLRMQNGQLWDIIDAPEVARGRVGCFIKLDERYRASQWTITQPVGWDVLGCL